jgi:murein DD-endopeptidase MepM/ murein hydrolase activator NlpD
MWKIQKSKKTLVLFACATMLLCSTPVTAKASIFESVSQFISNLTQSTTTEEVQQSNLQTVSLLKVNTVVPEKETSIEAQSGLLSVTTGPLRMSTEEEVYVSNEDAISLYVVKKGDTLNSIAKLFNVSVNTIVWANDLSSRKAEVGQTLTILPISGIKHIVIKGDTIQSIAKKYNADAGETALFNGVTAETDLVEGETIVVPDGEIAKTVKPKEEKKTNNSRTNRVTNSVKKIVKNLTRNGYFVRPIQGGVRTVGIHGHNAVDLAAPTGTPIMASASGTVIVSKVGGYNGGYGSYVVISHPNGTQTLYAHNSANLVSVGESVTQGQVIARVGSTGRSTGPHVHFEVRGAVNPF